MTPTPDTDLSLAPLRNFRGTPDQARVLLGCPTWNQALWGTTVYPPSTAEGARLFHYARMFDSVEVDSTFYHVPSLETAKRWREQTPDRFRFCLKIPRSISHNLAGDRRDWSAFLAYVQALGDRVGSVFLQLPPEFAYADRAHLVDFCRKAPFPIAVEFRHPSWFSGRQPLERLCQWFAEHGHSVVITDTLGRRDVSHGAITGDTLLVRYLGNGFDPSDQTRLSAWAHQLATAAEMVNDVYFFLHDPNQRYSPDMAQYLAQQLAQRGIDVRLPPPSTGLFGPRPGS